jgi:Card1-like, endonuclease domain
MKAQLILVGGRPMPNMLTILHDKPDIIVAITSQDKEEERPYLKSAIRELLKETKPDCNLAALDEEQYIVDAFNLNQIRAACERALQNHPNIENWLFNITGATTIMSIGAYEVANKHPQKVKWWYLDTGHSNVVTVSGSKQNKQLFETTVEQYIPACYCSLENGDLEAYRTTHETQWLAFAQYLGRNPQQVALLKDILKTIQDINRIEKRTIDANTSQSYNLKGLSRETIMMLEKAEGTGILSNWFKGDSACHFLLLEPQYKFLDGTWLEVYTYKEVEQAGIFSNYVWGKKIRDRYGRKNQLDVAMMYKAKLFIVECKTGYDAFKSGTLQTLESVANALGRNFVTRILVTSLPINDTEVDSRAKSSGIYIISRDDFPNIGKKLAEIASKEIGS